MSHSHRSHSRSSARASAKSSDGSCWGRSYGSVIDDHVQFQRGQHPVKLNPQIVYGARSHSHRLGRPHVVDVAVVVHLMDAVDDLCGAVRVGDGAFNDPVVPVREPFSLEAHFLTTHPLTPGCASSTTRI